MNQLELLEGKVVALSVRVEALERASQARLAGSADDLAAQRLAEECGFTVEVIVRPASLSGNPEKQTVARRLADKGWSAARIARVLRVCERTIERWLSRQGKGEELSG